MGLHKVYIELVFIDNFAVNMLIILVASVLTKTRKNWGRFALAAVVGGIYACVVFGTGGVGVSMPVKIAVSILMCFTAYYAKGEKGFWKNICAFYITSFVFAGAIYAVAFCSGSPYAFEGTLNIQPLIRYVLIGLLLGAILAGVFSRVHRRMAEREGRTVRMLLTCGQRRTSVKAYVDTGNMITEPLSGLGVVFVTESAAKSLFDRETINMMNCHGDTVTDRLRLVPCTTAAGTSVFYGIEIDSISMNGQINGIRAVVCIAKGTLADGCSAVVGSRIMDELMKGAQYDKITNPKDSRMDTGTAGNFGKHRLHKRQRIPSAAIDAEGGKRHCCSFWERETNRYDAC